MSEHNYDECNDVVCLECMKIERQRYNDSNPLYGMEKVYTGERKNNGNRKYYWRSKEIV